MQAPTVRTRVVVAFVISIFTIAADFPRELVGSVVKVLDGDTITILVDEVEHKIRLYGIDCPESAQPFGQKAKKYALEQVARKTVVVDVRDQDRYGRMVGVVTLPDGRNLNRELVRSGFAWWYERYAPDDSQLKALELEAREARRGLWADPRPVPPWEWRRGARQPSVGVSEPSTCCMVCRKGQPCGDSCIGRDKQCNKPKGCACAVSE